MDVFRPPDIAEHIRITETNPTNRLNPLSMKRYYVIQCPYLDCLSIQVTATTRLNCKNCNRNIDLKPHTSSYVIKTASLKRALELKQHWIRCNTKGIYSIASIVSSFAQSRPNQPVPLTA